jgi:hypothetical protein
MIKLAQSPQHGPNEHPIKDEHGHTKYVEKHSQSKINHYSKDQDTLILSSGEASDRLTLESTLIEAVWHFLDVPVNEEYVAEINTKIRSNPELLELKPNVVLGAPPTSNHHSHHSHHSQHSHHSHHSQPQYQPLKFRPHVEIKDYQPSFHSVPSSHSTSSEQGEIIVGSGGFSPSSQVYTKPKTVIKLKKQEVKKVKLVTPGLKHYATVPKFVNRNDYSSYFRSRSAPDEHRDASQRIVQSLYRRSPRNLLLPQYAPDALNYHF